MMLNYIHYCICLATILHVRKPVKRYRSYPFMQNPIMKTKNLRPVQPANLISKGRIKYGVTGSVKVRVTVRYRDRVSF